MKAKVEKMVMNNNCGNNSGVATVQMVGNILTQNGTNPSVTIRFTTMIFTERRSR